ncbi:hypothetical protein WR25_01898 [Diploscapter pachys]|uniref:Uncharacterized protein n=1 Tax=Diploscapter pachys TaxID=2018661 RepID=A0A2A2KY85_9BILA|nr:hypothetical protein WR25_01898 [Diploscapter pachys]
MVYIGIDLGTTYSCVSVIEHGKPKAIHHDNGKNIVPSVVAYGAEILIGNDALSSNIDMSNILYDSKRLIGWEFLHNLPNAETRQLWTFKVATKDKCAGYVLNKGTPNERFLKPEEVSAEILKYLKVCAEKYLNQKVTGVVVTVPALFQENQRAATEKAIELAKLELKGLLHEPNAAAIAYNEKTKLGNSKLLVFDFGGGTLDVSILEMVGNNVDVMAVSGDIHLGVEQVAKDQTQNRTQSLNRDPIPNQTWGPARDPLPHQTRDSTSNPTPNNPHIKPITSEVNNNPYIRDAIAIDIGTSKCKIATCKDKYIQIVKYGNSEHESSRSVPSYVALSEQCEWLVGRMAENYAVCLQNVIYVKLIDEPIAVAAAYAPRLNLHPKGDVALVFCMGAGYLQVAAYFIQQKAQEEKANYWTEWVITKISAIEPIVGNFAGDEIDRRIFEEMMEKLTDQNGNKEPNLSERAKRRLKIACEKMKCALSFAPHTRIDVDSLYRNDDNEDQDLVKVIQKDEIKGYYNEEVDKIIKQVGEIYKDLKPKFILLAGGSTRLPVITEYLTREFPGSTICNFLDVDEVAATGAAAIVSKTVTMAKKSIDYEEVIEIIKQEKEKEKRRNPFVYL